MKTIVREAWVAACADSRGDRFLCRADKGYWAVVDDPERASRFVSAAEAQGACDRFMAHQVGRNHGAPGNWAPLHMTVKATFRRP
jgi:hypothetical protein